MSTALQDRLALLVLGGNVTSAYSSQSHQPASHAPIGSAGWRFDAVVSIFAEALEAFLAQREKVRADVFTENRALPYPRTVRHWARMPGWCKLVLMPGRDLFVGGSAGKDPWAAARYAVGAIDEHRYSRAVRVIEAATVRMERLAALSVLGYGSKGAVP